MLHHADIFAQQLAWTESLSNNIDRLIAAVENCTVCYLPIESIETRRKVSWMYIVDLYFRVRKACLVEGMSVREASRVFDLHRDTVRKMLSNAVPPGYRRQRPPRRPKLEPYTGVIDRLLEDDLSLPKQSVTRQSASSSGCVTSTISRAATP